MREILQMCAFRKPYDIVVFRRSPTVAGNGERSALRGSLWWHVRGKTINSQRYPDFATAFGATTDMAGTCYWLAPVASDPSATWAGPPGALPELVHCPLLMCKF